MNVLLDGWFKFNVGDGALFAVFGLVFVILGISLLVLIFTALGAVMKRVNLKKNAPKQNIVPAHPLTSGEKEEGIPPEVVAAITGALMAYFERENVKCDFVVRRIKKL